MLKRTKNFFRESDAFGISFTFRYKRENNFATWQGGVLTFLIIAMYLFFGIYYFIPFVRKKNYTIYYNTISVPETKKYKLDIDISPFKFELECRSQQEEIKRYLDFKASYYYKETNDSGTFIIEKVDFKLVNSTLQNENNDKKNYTISDRYGGKEFKYFEISLNSKESQNISEIDKLLLENDCKLEFHYNDYSIDYDKLEKPLEKYENEFFLQLNPYFCVKVNTFFMKQTLANDHDILFEFEDDEINTNIFSRTEQYFVYKGNYDKNEEYRSEDYESYAKIYIRADPRKVQIKRKYQTFFEFWADTFSFWNALVAIIAFILNSFYKFYAFYYIGNEIFFFKEKENKEINHLNYSEKNKEIKRLMDITKTKTKDYERSSTNNIRNIEKNNDENINQTNYDLKVEDKVANFDNQKITKYSFNFYEIPVIIKWLKLFRCINICKCQKLMNKMNLYSKAKNIMKEKLNIVVYIKNMLYLDTFKKKIKNEDKDYILQFLGMPIKSPAQSEINEENSNINNNIYLKSSMMKSDIKNSLKSSNIKKTEEN